MKALLMVGAVAAILAAAAGGKPAAIATKDSPKDFPVQVPSADASVTAVFDGEAPPAELEVPLVFGTSALSFQFKGEKAPYAFKPKGELEFSDWSFDIFSPDGKHVLLLQDRFGPYHVVATSKLKAYLQGKAQPDRVIAETLPSPGSAAVVHTAAKWLSNTELEYQVGGEKMERRTASLAK